MDKDAVILFSELTETIALLTIHMLNSLFLPVHILNICSRFLCCSGNTGY